MADVRGLIRQSPPVDVSKPYDASTLKGKMILITGGAQGLGAHMARHWAAQGAHITIGDVADGAGEEFVASLRTQYPESVFTFQHCDVKNWESQVSLFDTAVKVSPHGGIDIVVPNAGIIRPRQSTIFENPELVDGKLPEPDTSTFDVNIKGVWLTTHLALYHLPLNNRPDRCILLIGSLSSLFPLPGQPAYVMSKHAVLGLFRTLRATGFRHGIRVNMVAPYFIAQTNMLRPVVEALFVAGSSGPAEIPDVMDAATRLVADEAIAGRALVVGPKMKSKGHDFVEEDPLMVVGDEEGGGQGRAVWECYAHDYDEVDSFINRYLWVLSATAAARGWFAWLTDAFSIWRRQRR